MSSQRFALEFKEEAVRQVVERGYAAPDVAARPGAHSGVCPLRRIWWWPAIDREPGFRRMKAMVRHLSHSIEFKRQVAQGYLAGETLHSLAR